MKKNIFIIFMIATAFLTVQLTSCKDDTAVTGVKLDKNKHRMVVETNFTLIATITPSGATNKDLTWISDRPVVADVDDNGVVTAYSVGEAVIYVITKSGIFRDFCELTVTGKPVSGVTLNKHSLSLKIGEQQLLIATVEPELADNKNVTWSSNPAGIVVVNNGNVRAIGQGTTSVIVTTVDGNRTDACNVTVDNTYYNIMINPGFEEPNDASANLLGWTIVPQAWFDAYYTGNAMGPGLPSGGVVDRIGLPNNESFFVSGNGNYFNQARVGNWCSRIGGNVTGGLYQIVDVIPGATYKFNGLIGMRCNDNDSKIQSWETVKFLSENGLNTYHQIPIPIDNVYLHNGQPTNIERVEGTFKIPTGVTKVRIQLDQRNFDSPNRAPLRLMDDFKFHWLSD